MKNTTLDVLKGLAIALVVYGHMIQRAAILSGENFFAHPVFKIIYTFHMPLFFFISGYLVALSLGHRSIVDVFKARCRGLLVPYVVWGTMGVLVLHFSNPIVGRYLFVQFISDWIYQLFIDPNVWFLWTLFFCSVILLISLKLQKYCGRWVFPLGYLFMVLLPSVEWGGLHYIIWFYPFYVVGYVMNRYGASWIQKVNRPVILALALMLFICLVPWWSIDDYIYVNRMHTLSPDVFANIVEYAYRYSLGFLGIGLAFFVGAYVAKTPLCRFWSFIGIYSLDIYLLQRYLVEGILPRVWARTGIMLDASSPLFLLVFAPVATALAVGLCIVISRLLIRSNGLMNMLFLGHRV
jgi:fucose 4-O-acetylase-like acetyltransferase